MNLVKDYIGYYIDQIPFLLCDDIIEYVENTLNKDKKKYKFWELLSSNEK